MAQALYYEVKDKIDVLAWLPGHVDTKIATGTEKCCTGTCSSSEAIDGMLRDIGKERKTFGHVKHWMGSSMLECMPMSILAPKFAQVFERMFNE